MLKYILLISLALMLDPMLANTPSLDAIVASVDKNSDASLKFLSMIFGSVDGLLPASNVILIPMMIKYFNYGLMAYLGLIISYSITNSVVKTSAQGKLLGKQGGATAAFFRTFTSSATLMPIPNFSGYSLMQIIMLKIIIAGISLANSVWANVTDYAVQHNSIFNNANTQSKAKYIDKSKVIGEQNLNNFLFCVAYYDSARNVKPEDFVSLRPGFKVLNNSGDSLDISSDYNCGKLNVNFAIDNSKQSFKQNVVTTFTNYLDTVRNIAEMAVMTTYNKGIMPNQHELYNYSRNSMISVIKRYLQAKPSPVPRLGWDQGWIFAGMHYNRLVNNSLSSSTDKDKPLNLSVIGNSIIPEGSSDELIAFSQSLKTNLPPSNNKSVKNKVLDDIYLRSILSVVPISPESAAMNNLEADISIPKKTETIDETISELDKKNEEEKRGEKSFGRASGGIFTGIFKGLGSDWGLGMFFSGNFDDSKGPLNIVERDIVVARDVQIFVFKIYRAWLQLMPSEYRTELNPLTRIRDFGLDAVSAGFEFFLNITQDTFFASMGAQLTVMGESMKYMIKSLAMQGSSTILSGIAAVTYNIPLVGPVIWAVLKASVAVVNGLGSYYGSMASIPQLYAPLVVASRLMYLSLSLAAALPPIVLGLMFAIYIPFLPFMIFLFSAIGWLISVVESLVAAPIVAVGIAKPQGHDFLGRAQQIVMLLSAVFIRPVAIVIGFVMAILLFNAASSVFDKIYFPFVEHYTKGIAPGNHGLSLAIIIIMLMYGYIMISIIRYSFSLTHMLPNYIVKWIGLAPLSGGEEEAMESVESSMKDALSKGLQGASLGVSSMRG